MTSRYVQAAAYIMGGCDIWGVVKEGDPEKIAQVYDFAIQLAEMTL